MYALVFIPSHCISNKSVSIIDDLPKLYSSITDICELYCIVYERGHWCLANRVSNVILTMSK